LPGSGASYVITTAVRLTGVLYATALEAALGDVVERHESLRTVFPERGGVPRQLILEASAARPRLERRALSEGALAAALGEAARRGVGLGSEPPVGGDLFWRGGGEDGLLVAVHHLPNDGWALAPLWRDLARAYAGRLAGRGAEFLPLPVQYADYTLWQHDVLGSESDPESAISRQLSYWSAALAGLPDQLELPSARARPAVSSH